MTATSMTSRSELAQEAGLPGTLRDDSYTLPPGLSFERWASIGATLQQMLRSVNWWAGDWLRYGEVHFGEDAYQAVKDIAGLSDGALRNAAWVADRYPPATRVARLSWSHHRAALLDGLPISESHALLAEAASEQLPVRELIDRARARKDAIRAEAQAVSAPSCAADGPWAPAIDDLIPEYRTALLAAARASVGLSGDIDSFLSGALWALREAGCCVWFGDRWVEG